MLGCLAIVIESTRCIVMLSINMQFIYSTLSVCDMLGPTQGRSVYIVYVRYIHVTLQVCFEVKMFASNARLYKV